MDRTKPIYFRPSVVDAEILDLIASNHRVARDSPTDLIRRALEEYWINHSPEGGRSKSKMINRHEKKTDLILEHFGLEFVEEDKDE